MRKKPEVLRERISRESEQALADEELAHFVHTKIKNGEVIERADDVRIEYEASKGIKV